MLDSPDRCSTTFFTMVETEVGVVLTKGTTVVGAMMAGLMVVLVVFTTIFITCLVTSFTNMSLSSPAVMLMAGPARSVVLTTKEMTGTVVFSSNPSQMDEVRKWTKHADFH